MKNNVAWIIKNGGGAVKVTFTSGWPWVKETASGRILTDGCSGNTYGFMPLEPTDQVIILQQGGEFKPAGVTLGEVMIGQNAHNQ
jgi:hypothetical protein